MADVPMYMNVVFILTTLATVVFFYFATRRNLIALAAVGFLMAMNALLSLNGFFLDGQSVPPRIAVVLLPNILLMLFAFFSRAGKAFIAQIDLRIYTFLHIIRVPVEFTILWLFMHQLMPQSMTFEGRNFDILSGITAPIVGLLAWRAGKPNRRLLLVWNVLCLLLVLQVVTTGILSAPTPFQLLEFAQPNRGVLYFPFVWLPSTVVPIVIFGHLVALQRLTAGEEATS